MNLAVHARERHAPVPVGGARRAGERQWRSNQTWRFPERDKKEQSVESAVDAEELIHGRRRTDRCGKVLGNDAGCVQRKKGNHFRQGEQRRKAGRFRANRGYDLRRRRHRLGGRHLATAARRRISRALARPRIGPMGRRTATRSHLPRHQPTCQRRNRRQQNGQQHKETRRCTGYPGFVAEKTHGHSLPAVPNTVNRAKTSKHPESPSRSDLSGEQTGTCAAIAPQAILCYPLCKRRCRPWRQILRSTMRCSRKP